MVMDFDPKEGTVTNAVWILAMLLVAIVLFGCGETERPSRPPATATAMAAAAAAAASPVGQPAPPKETARVEPTTPPRSSVSYPMKYFGLAPTEELIATSDTIIRGTLLSTATSTLQAEYSYHPYTWAANLEFRFQVHEYLKGSGPDEIVAIVTGGPYETEADAEAALPEIVAFHDARWDDREAIVFMNSSWIGPSSHASIGEADDRFRIGNMTLANEDAYTLASRHSKKWLPEDASSGARSDEGPSGKRFLLDVPAPTTASKGERGSTTRYTAPTIRLTELEDMIASVEAVASISVMHRECFRYKFESIRGREVGQGSNPAGGVRAYTITHGSGRPAGTIVRSEQLDHALSPDNTGQDWFEGPDRDLVAIVDSDFEPYTVSSSLGELSYYRHKNSIVTIRPLPAGTYRYEYHAYSALEGLCGDEEDNWHFIHDTTLIVTAPPRTLHEAFFDPVDIGSAVGADNTNGVLEPNAFSLDAATTTISSLKWEGGAVSMTLSPTASLADYAIHFIDITGTTTLSLTPDNASTTALTWTVPDKPWADGDLLMMRMRRFVSSDATLSGLALTGIDLAFSPDTTTYAATVAATTTQTTVTPTTNHGSATYVVKLAGVVDNDGTIDLAVGENVITVVVTAEDTTTTQTYTVTVTRAVPSSPVTVTLIPRVDILTFFDIDIQWSYSGTCENYFLAITTDTEYMIRSLGFHSPQASSHYVEGGWLYNDVPDFWVVVQCRGSGDSQEVGRASLRAAHPDNN